MRASSSTAEKTVSAKSRRWGATVFSVGLIAIILWPVRQNWSDQPRDDCPLSYYPMFTKTRGEFLRITFLEGIDHHGNVHRLPIDCVADGGFHQARKQLNRYVAEGRSHAACLLVAKYVRRKANEPYCNIVSVQVLLGDFQLARYMHGQVEPTRERVIASCEVDRGE